MLDCANGSACAVARRILDGTGASVDVRFNEPDGVNINLECGATAPQALAAMVADKALIWASRSTATPTAAWRWTSAARSSMATS